jgi:hypothetical protein
MDKNEAITELRKLVPEHDRLAAARQDMTNKIATILGQFDTDGIYDICEEYLETGGDDGR